jgi:hypothetical protein
VKCLILILAFFVSSSSLNAQNTNSRLRDELGKMVEVDQNGRERCIKQTAEEQMKCLAVLFETVDKVNTKRLNEIFNQYGFPTARLIGKDGVKSFMLLLQHTTDESLRQKSLPAIRKAFMRKEISPMDYSNYVDRLLVRQGKLQIYGANFEIRDGKLVMTPVVDPKNLNKRRKKIGLPPIAEYAQGLKDLYHLETVIPR